MNNSSFTGDLTDPKEWEKALGLVVVPLFGSQVGVRNINPDDSHSVMLNGKAASFALSITEDPNLSYAPDPISWSWSANLRHSLIIDKKREEMFLRRWDTPPDTIRRYRLPNRAKAAAASQELLKIIENNPAPRLEDVVLFVMRGFRQIRGAFACEDINSIRLLNLFLLGRAKVTSGDLSQVEWGRLNDVNALISEMTPQQKRILGTSIFSSEILNQNVRGITDFFINNKPITSIDFNPALLLRHASGSLYQEAHIHLEKFNQLSLPGLASQNAPSGLLRKDVRFTPPTLARALVQQAFNAFCFDDKESIEILDPACGSGVFLHEALRELNNRNYRGKVTLRGFDNSAISYYISNFCLELTKLESNSFIDLIINIQECDALHDESDWGKPDIILMNPPFVPWDRISNDDKEIVRSVLGELVKGRADLSMAFIWKAAQSLTAGGIMTTVLPAPIFETYSGLKWREALSDLGQILLLGRFEDFGFFRNSMVEPGFLALQRKQTDGILSNEPVKIVLSKSNSGDKALRALRKVDISDVSGEGWEINTIESSYVKPDTWTPRSKKLIKMIEYFQETNMAKAIDLFNIRQGVLTGYNKSFLVSSSEFKEFPKKEKVFFRPAAENSTIQIGKLENKEYIFYPYNERELMILTEEELQKLVPTYYEEKLLPNKPILIKRFGIDANRWWILSRPRSWQMRQIKKLVTKHFGHKGSFAYDSDGSFIVIQGYAWLWKSKINVENEEVFEFHNTELPWAYLAIMNSNLFETLLDCFCPRIQGGQFNLSVRFVKNVFIPDLSDPNRVSGSTVQQLIRFGHQIHRGRLYELEGLDDVVKNAYSIS
ncbi:MAG: N-6 DNA methylase [Candidatus Hatepunaea meridiana]|nr:N-6 DNA methylase [Candidatus Hatepunaea meridiana]